MLNRIFVVASTTLTSTGSAVSSFLPFDTSCMKLPTQLVIKATGQGAYVRLSSDSTPATNKDVLVQGGDHVVMSVAGRRYISVLSDGASSTVSIGALSTGVSGNVGATLDLSLLTSLDPRITFSRTSNATLTDSNGRVSYAPHNLLTNSEDFEAAAWTPSNASVTANNAVAPDGTSTADKLIANTTLGGHFTGQSVTTTAVAHTFSAYLKAAGYNWAVLYLSGPNVGIFFDLSNGTTGSTFVGAPTSSSITAVGNGWYRCSITATLSTAATPRIYIASADGPSASFAGDNVSGLFAWGAQLNVGALQSYNSTTPRNLLGFTQEFDNAAWTKTTATITANTAAGPDGYATADTVTATGANATVLASYTAVVAPYTFSVYLQRKTGTGTVEITADGVTYSTVTLTPSLSRYSITTTPAAGAKTAGIRIGTNGDEVYMAAAQLSNSASVDPYVYNPQAAPTSTAYYGPRFDYNPVTLAANGLLIEEQRTNLLTYSEDFSNAVWTKIAGGTGVVPVITANSGVAPDGTLTADRMQMSLGGGTTTSDISSIYQVLTFASGVNHTYSVWLRSNDSNTYTILARDDVGSAAVAGLWSVTPTWQRFNYTATSTTTSSNGLRLWLRGALGTSATADVLIWGAQLEAGSFATSYIPTVASQVTRAADNASMLGDNFATWFNASQGTFAAAFVPTVIGSYAVYAATDGTTNNRIQGPAADSTQFLVSTGGVVQALLDGGTVPPAIQSKTAGAYRTDDFALSLNGGAVAVDTLGSLPTVNSLAIGRLTTVEYLNGTIRSISYYPTRLPNATLQAITA